MPEEKTAFTALYIASRDNVSRGGVVYSFLVPWDETGEADRILGGRARPDMPVNVGIVPVSLDGTET